MSGIKNVWQFYRDGFRGLTPTSKKLWLIIFLKLFIMFAVLRAFFFPNFLKLNGAKSAEDKSNFVGTELIDRKAE